MHLKPNFYPLGVRIFKKQHFKNPFYSTGNCGLTAERNIFDSHISGRQRGLGVAVGPRSVRSKLPAGYRSGQSEPAASPFTTSSAFCVVGGPRFHGSVRTLPAEIR